MESFSYIFTSDRVVSCSEYLFSCIQFFADFLCLWCKCVWIQTRKSGGGWLEVGRFHGLDSRVWFIALGEGSSVRRLMPVLWVLYYIHMLLL